MSDKLDWFVLGVVVCLIFTVIGVMIGSQIANYETPRSMCFGNYEHCHIPDDAVIDNRVLSVNAHERFYTNDTLDKIKEDAYTRGMIDGRGSILSKQSNGTYKHVDLGVQEGYEPSPYPQWREYADCITKNISCNDGDLYDQKENFYVSVPRRTYANFSTSIPDNATIVSATCVGCANAAQELEYRDKGTP